MNKLSVITGTVLCLILLSCHDGSRHEATLRWADSLNRNYIEIPSDSQLLEAVAFYDRHGTPNERMRAHYLLGCAYRDMGEAPKALECYHDAADCADTLSSDCDYALLSKVYGQSSMLFYERYLHKEMIPLLCSAINAAKKGACFDLEANYLEMLGSAYEQSGDLDNAISTYVTVVDSYKKAGMLSDANITTGMLASAYVSADKLDKADSCMQLYEKFSGLFDTEGNIVAGKEVYYYVKGLFYLKKGNTTDAELLFRKELSKAITTDDSLSAYNGLRQLYESTGKNDSVAKYSSLCFQNVIVQFSDSSIQQMENIQARYNYGHSQQRAKKAINTNHYLRRALSFILLVCTVLVLATVWYVRKIKNGQARLRKEIEKFAHKDSYSNSEKCGDDTPSGVPVMDNILYSHIQQAVNNPVKNALSSADWTQLESYFDSRLPRFRQIINGNGQVLRQEEYRMCILIRMNFSPRNICSLMDMRSSHVSNMRRRLLQKVFGLDGKPKDFDIRIREIE